MSADKKVIFLAGNPNVGKSTVFNAVTGMNQHTGNWSGKTVEFARGSRTHNGQEIEIVDLPGTYSLHARSKEEETARDFICREKHDAIILVCDATCLERNLILVLQTLELTPNVVVCVNMMDEAKRKKIKIDLNKLQELLGVQVVSATAKSKKGLSSLIDAALSAQEYAKTHEPYKINYIKNCTDEKKSVCAVLEAEYISGETVKFENRSYRQKERKIDKILTNKITGIPIMLALLCFIFWLTITGANYPSQIISDFLFGIETKLTNFFEWMNAPGWLHGVIVLGMYRVLAWVISVMLPPMAIFFPLFTILEDFGYLPRIAFNLDSQFKKANTCGKQALTMCMGFGCNAVGVTGCRIIDSPRERLIAIITNSFVPCNGRFPTLIAIISMFFVVGGLSSGESVFSVLILAGVILLGIMLTLLMSKLLSKTVLKGIPSSFILELPPYRIPQFGKVLVRSIFDRTLFVLGRAVIVAAPAGIIIWVMANLTVGDMSILSHTAAVLDPFAQLLGLDGVILLAFILGFPANEIVIPLIIMIYMQSGVLTDYNGLSSLKALLVDNGWTWVTAVSVMLFCLAHWPCSTTCLTIRKETKSLKWTAVSVILPTLTGMLMCFIFASIARLF